MKKIAIDEPARLDRFVKSFGASHSEDFKGLVLRLVESGQSLESVSALSGVSLSTLYDWVKDWNEKRDWLREPSRARWRLKSPPE